MITWYQFIIYSIANVLCMYATLMFVNSFLGKFEWWVFKHKRDMAFMCIVTIGITILTIMMKFYRTVPLDYLIINEIVIYSIIVWFIFKKFSVRWYMPFIITGIYWCVIIIFEMGYVAIITNFVTQDAFLTYNVQLGGASFFAACFAITSVVISRFKIKYFENVTIPRTMASYVVITPIVLLVVYNFVFINSLKSESIFSGYIILILGMLMFIFLVYMWLYQRNKSLEVRHLEEEIGRLSDYALTMDNLYDEMRQYKHDINNTLLGLRAYIEAGDEAAAQKYFYEDIIGIAPFVNPTYQLIAMLRGLQNMPLKGLLISKYERMQTLGINMSIANAQAIGMIPMKDVDLCRAIGIILDNAIESAAEAGTKEIHVIFDKADTDISIRIQNSYYGEIDLKRIGEKGYSTKGSGRGIGIQSLKSIIHSYHNASIKFELGEGYFGTIISLEA